MKTLAFALLFAPALAFGQARVDSLDWLAGTWVQETAKEKVTESWLGPANGLMVAVNLTARASGGRSFEFLRIADTPGGFSYYASPGGKAPVEFKLKESGDKRVVFENATHDFPQRILYWREDEHLVARVEGTLKGQERSEQWRFSRK